MTQLEVVQFLRGRALRFKWVSIILFLIIYLPIAIYINKTYGVPSRVMRYLSLPIVLFLYTAYKNRKGNYILGYNRYITNEIVNTIRPSWSYQPEDGIDTDIILDTYLIDRKSFMNTSNLMSGRVDDVSFRFCHVETTKNNNMAARLPKTIFKGYFFEFDYPKYTSTDIHVHPPLTKDFGDVLKVPKKIETDAKEFDKAYRSYCDDPVEARYILTLNLMARMIDVQEALPGKVAFLFKEGKVFIAISVKGSTIEPKVSKKIDMNEVSDIHRNTFDLVEQFIEELNLQSNLWNREELDA